MNEQVAELNVGNQTDNQTEQVPETPTKATDQWLDTVIKPMDAAGLKRFGRFMGHLSAAVALDVAGSEAFLAHDIPRGLAEIGLGLYFKFAGARSLKT